VYYNNLLWFTGYIITSLLDVIKNKALIVVFTQGLLYHTETLKQISKPFL